MDDEGNPWLLRTREALKEARKIEANLATIWLDIANAYGSIPHKPIIFALQRYGIPPNWITITNESTASPLLTHHQVVGTDMKEGFLQATLCQLFYF